MSTMMTLKAFFFDLKSNFPWAVGGSVLGSVLLLGMVYKAYNMKMKTAQNERLRRNLLDLCHIA